jgi:iron-sulfur cluster assembly protein/iron-sulfur cluster insertion protein
MITLTERAAHRIRELADQHEAGDRRLRVFVDAGGCSGLEYGMSFAPPAEGDRELESHGVPFCVAADSYDYLDGSQIDFDDGLMGKGFEIRNPNAQSTCGCGKSFN